MATQCSGKTQMETRDKIYNLVNELKAGLNEKLRKFSMKTAEKELSAEELLEYFKLNFKLTYIVDPQINEDWPKRDPLMEKAMDIEKLGRECISKEGLKQMANLEGFLERLYNGYLSYGVYVNEIQKSLEILDAIETKLNPRILFY